MKSFPPSGNMTGGNMLVGHDDDDEDDTDDMNDDYLLSFSHLAPQKPKAVSDLPNLHSRVCRGWYSIQGYAGDGMVLDGMRGMT